MGHSSIPSLNKVGQSNFWNFMWDDKHDYTRSLHESLFLQEFITNFFESFSYKVLILNSNKHDFFEKNLEKYNIFIKQKYIYRDLARHLKINDYKYFFSKIWVMKFQKHVIIFFFLYSFDLVRLRKKKKLSNLKYLNTIINNYTLNTCILKKNLNNFNKHLKFRNNF